VSDAQTNSPQALTPSEQRKLRRLGSGPCPWPSAETHTTGQRLNLRCGC